MTIKVSQQASKIPQEVLTLVSILAIAEPIVLRADEIDGELANLISEFWDVGGPYTKEGWNVLDKILKRIADLKICANCRHSRLNIGLYRVREVLLREHIDKPILYCEKREISVNPCETCDNFKKDDQHVRKTLECVRHYLTTLEGVSRDMRSVEE